MSTEQQTLDGSTVEKHECPTCGRDDFANQLGVKQHHEYAHGVKFCDLGCEHKCPEDECNRAFEDKSGLRKHHTDVHDGSISHATKNCTWCGVEVSIPIRRVEKQERFFCGDEHRNNWMREGGEGCPAWDGGDETVECDYCGEETQLPTWRVKDSEYHFCSPEHKHKFHSDLIEGEQHPNWKEKKKIECANDNCSETLTLLPCHAERSENHFCDPQCHGEWRSEYLSGMNHPQWGGGGYAPFYNAIRKYISKEDWWDITVQHRRENDKCELCGERKEHLHTHHIIPIMGGGTNDKYNRMTLCLECHPTVENYTSDFIGFQLDELSESKSTSDD